MAEGSRKPRNLSLDSEAVARGERYSRLHDTNLSRLVDNFLRALPLPADPRAELRSPVVKRLLGVARGGNTDRAAYREHLHRKYGGR